jgi:hypothetical protein
MGFPHFIVIDNDSTDGVVEQLKSCPDVTLFAAHGSYKRARYGVDWVNYVLSKYCVGKWILHVDADEFLVCGTTTAQPVDIARITERLMAERRKSLHAMILDMYSDRPSRDNTYTPGSDPLTVCPLYDCSGYRSYYNSLEQTTWIKAGPRARLFFPDIKKGPALNKTPLIHWRRHYAFIKSAHQLFPPHLNGPGPRNVGEQQAVLLHFKFLASFTDQLAVEGTRQQHTNEYAAYRDAGSVSFIADSTRRYEGWESMAADGLIRPFDEEPSQARAGTPAKPARPGEDLSPVANDDRDGQWARADR